MLVSVRVRFGSVNIFRVWLTAFPFEPAFNGEERQLRPGSVA